MPRQLPRPSLRCSVPAPAVQPGSVISLSLPPVRLLPAPSPVPATSRVPGEAERAQKTHLGQGVGLPPGRREPHLGRAALPRAQPCASPLPRPDPRVSRTTNVNAAAGFGWAEEGKKRVRFAFLRARTALALGVGAPTAPVSLGWPYTGQVSGPCSYLGQAKLSRPAESHHAQ